MPSWKKIILSGSNAVLAEITASGNVSSSAISTASFGTYIGDGSQLSGISSTPFPFTGDAQITGSLVISGSSAGNLLEVGSSTSGKSRLIVTDNSAYYNTFINGELYLGANGVTPMIHFGSDNIIYSMRRNGTQGLTIGNIEFNGANNVSVYQNLEVGRNTGNIGSNKLTVTGSAHIQGSGSGIFSVEGSVGTLFSVDDGLDDVIFAANNISGTPVISANADNTVKLGKLGGFGIVISGSTPAPNDSQAKIIITGSIHTSGSLGVGMAASSTIGRIDAKNDVVAFSTSDKRLKDNITPIENALNKVSQVQGIEFDWVEKEGIHGNEGHDVGVIAQEIEKVLPEVVTTRDNGYKAVKYEKIIPLLVEAIKELQEEIKELKKDK